MTRVLADSFNQGYSKLKNLIVKQVNGQKVNSLGSLNKALQKPVVLEGKSYVLINFDGGNGQAVLAFEKYTQAHRRIAKIYNIPQNSFFIPTSGRGILTLTKRFLFKGELEKCPRL